jgi:hypothetical protein
MYDFSQAVIKAHQNIHSAIRLRSILEAGNTEERMLPFSNTHAGYAHVAIRECLMIALVMSLPRLYEEAGSDNASIDRALNLLNRKEHIELIELQGGLGKRRTMSA